MIADMLIAFCKTKNYTIALEEFSDTRYQIIHGVSGTVYIVDVKRNSIKSVRTTLKRNGFEQNLWHMGGDMFLKAVQTYMESLGVNTTLIIKEELRRNYQYGGKNSYVESLVADTPK